MIDELKIVLAPANTLDVELQGQEPLQLQLNAPVTQTGTTNYNLLGNKPQINNVTLQGNKTASDLGLQDALTFDDTPTEDSTNPVTSDGVYDALAAKQNALTFDAAPTDGSSNPVTSDGVYDAVTGKVAKAGDTMTGQLTTQLPDVVIGGTTSLTNDPLKVTDKNGTRYGLIRATENTDGSTELSFIHVPTVSGSSVWHGVTLGVKSDKSKYVTFGDAGAWRSGLGAVSKSGDTMTGNLVFANGNYKGININGGTGAPSINMYNTGTRLTIDEYASGSTGGERYLLPIPTSHVSDVWYEILTSRDHGLQPLQLGSGETGTLTMKSNFAILFGMRGESYYIAMTTYWDSSINVIASGGTTPTVTKSENNKTVSIKNNKNNSMVFVLLG